jgi:hypothetical protein
VPPSTTQLEYLPGYHLYFSQMRPNPFRNYFKGLSARRGVAPGPQRSAMRSTGEGEFVCWLAFSPGFSIGKRPRCTCKMWSYLLDLLQLLVLDKGTDSPSQSQSRQATQQRQHANMQDVPSGGHRSEATSAFTGWPFCLACSVRPRHGPKSSHRSRCHAVPMSGCRKGYFYTPCKAVLAVSRTRILVSLHVPCTTSSR